jgi:hypothetical protein
MYLIQQYVYHIKPCQEQTQEALPNYLHTNEILPGNYIPRHWALGIFHAIFSFSHLVEKIVASIILLVGIHTWLEERRIQQLPEKKRREWSWHNRRDIIWEFGMPTIGILIILGGFYYVAVRTPHYFYSFQFMKTDL